MSRDRRRAGVPRRVWPVLLGALLGAIVGAVLAINVVIFAGFERGYETTSTEIVDRRPALAVVIIVLLILPPVVGAALGFRYRPRPPV